ncbi:MAG: hypothetical protein IJ695_03415 [Butyrivibrio sp.]|nr:hypothetical protein [Butyrivibrio sp.]
MLTISAPIEIKAKTTYLKDPESFYHRITGNYSLMETRIDSEDLLHIATTPPEIYVQEGEGMTSILSHSERNETNLNKVDILNNVINRIVVSADTNLTYQDRVFITDALYRLGIKDEKKFMNTFYRIAEETKNTNTLINLYLERGGELREIVDEINTRESEMTVTERESSESATENFLYSSVMRRLQTGAIYQIVSNFNKSTEETTVDSREYAISNQSYTAQNILLSVLRDRAGVGSENFVFLSENTYEDILAEGDTTNENIRNELNSAVLMDIVKNLYHTAYDRFYKGGDTFYRFEDVFFKASDQIFLRMIGGARNNFLLQQRISENIIEQQSNVPPAVTELPRIPQEEEAKEGDTFVRSGDTILDSQNETNLNVTRETEKVIHDSERVRDNYYREKSRESSTAIEIPDNGEGSEIPSEETTYNLGNTVINAPDQRIVRMIEGAERSYYEQDRLRENFYEENNRLVNREIEILDKAESEKITENEVNKLIETVNEINVQNEMRRREYEQVVERSRQESVQTESPANIMKQTMQDAALALSNPEQLMEQLSVRQQRQEKRRSLILEQLREVVPDQSMEIYQLLEQYYEGDTNVINNNLVRRAEVGELLADISSVENEVPESSAVRPMDAETEEFLESIKRARQEEEGILPPSGRKMRSPVETVYRQTETLTAEDVTEQLSTLETNIQKQINKTVETQVINENHVTQQNVVRTNNQRETQITARDVEAIVQNEVRNKMNTISNQVMNKIERQMKNEKMRRGY